MAETTHQVNGKITGKEHFEQVTKDVTPAEVSLEDRVTKLEYAIFPHLKPGETPEEEETAPPAKKTKK